MSAAIVQHVQGLDAIAWLGQVKGHTDVPHNSSSSQLCIDPPPFGTQCTHHMKNTAFRAAPPSSAQTKALTWVGGRFGYESMDRSARLAQCRLCKRGRSQGRCGQSEDTTCASRAAATACSSRGG